MTVALGLACPLCGGHMVPVHGHHECRGTGGCGWRSSCCDGGEQPAAATHNPRSGDTSPSSREARC